MHRCPSCGVDLAIEIRTAEQELPQQERRSQGPRRRTNGSLEPAPMTPERIGEYRFPFGKHRGLSLDEISRGDGGYLEWVKKNMGDRPNVQCMVGAYLDGDR